MSEWFSKMIGSDFPMNTSCKGRLFFTLKGACTPATEQLSQSNLREIRKNTYKRLTI